MCQGVQDADDFFWNRSQVNLGYIKACLHCALSLRINQEETLEKILVHRDPR